MSNCKGCGECAGKCGETPGRVAYVAKHGAMDGVAEAHAIRNWQTMEGERSRESWEAAAQAVLKHATPPAPADRAEVSNLTSGCLQYTAMQVVAMEAAADSERPISQRRQMLLSEAHARIAELERRLAAAPVAVRVPLTDEQISCALDAGGVGHQITRHAITRVNYWTTRGSTDVRSIVRAIEAAHGITPTPPEAQEAAPTAADVERARATLSKARNALNVVSQWNVSEETGKRLEALALECDEAVGYLAAPGSPVDHGSMQGEAQEAAIARRLAAAKGGEA